MLIYAQVWYEERVNICYVIAFQCDITAIEHIYLTKLSTNRAAAQRQNNDKQALKMMQEELSKNVVKLNASTNQNKQLETQLARFKEQLQKMENTQVSSSTVYMRRCRISFTS